MRIQADMSDIDIRHFFRTYMSQANPSAVCGRVADAVRHVILTFPSNSMSVQEQSLMTQFLRSVEALQEATLKQEEALVEPHLPCEGKRDCTNDVVYVDQKGYLYCRTCGDRFRSSGRACRTLEQNELSRLRQGKTINY